MRKERKERKMGKNDVIGRRRKKAKKGRKEEGKKKGGREGGKKNRGRKFRKDEGKEGRKQGTKEGERKEGREQLQKFLIDVFFFTFFLRTMTFSAGMYRNGKINLQLKFPVPSRDLSKECIQQRSRS